MRSPSMSIRALRERAGQGSMVWTATLRAEESPAWGLMLSLLEL
jgi:hypothetical protein